MKKSIVVLAFAFVAAGARAQLTTNNGQQYLLDQKRCFHNLACHNSGIGTDWPNEGSSPKKTFCR